MEQFNYLYIQVKIGQYNKCIVKDNKLQNNQKNLHNTKYFNSHNVIAILHHYLYLIYKINNIQHHNQDLFNFVQNILTIKLEIVFYVLVLRDSKQFKTYNK